MILPKLLLPLALLILAPAITFAGPQQSAATAGKSKIATPAGWSDDFENAQKQARAQNKDLLVAFSGSDWCGWCVRLEKEVFTQAPFTEKASESFVPVYVDLPQDKERLSPAAKRQNEGLAARYRIDRFPTVLLIDTDGDIIAQTGYLEGGPENYLKTILRLRDDSKRAPEYMAQKQIRQVPQGPDRARRLDAILKPLPTQAQIRLSQYVREVLAYDPTGSRGLRKNYPYFTEILPQEQLIIESITKITHEINDAIAARGKTKDKSEHVRIIASVVRKHASSLKTLKKNAIAAYKRFPQDSEATRRLDKLLMRLNDLLFYVENRK